jgi:hypothetical protein
MSVITVSRRGSLAIASLAILGMAGALLAAHAAAQSPGTVGTRSGAATTKPASAALSATTSYSAAGGLNGVAAAANNNAWAVGYSGSFSSPKILMLHWNGSVWSTVASKQLNLIGSAGDLSGITAVNATDAYAVGYTGNPGGTTHTLLLHWNGSTWSTVTRPAPVSGGGLTAITATTKSGWALGYYATGPSALDYWSLAFRLTGATWSRVSSSTNDITFTGVATTSAGASWATANQVAMVTGSLAKWSGTGWSWLHSFPVQGMYHALNGIAAGPGGIAFAVGANGNIPPTPALSMERTGHAWVKAPVSAPQGSSLNAVTFAPGGTAWAAGSAGPDGGDAMIVRWNGHEWTRVPTPAKTAPLSGIGFSAAKYGWAVGSTSLTSGGTRTLILYWNGRTWS